MATYNGNDVFLSVGGEDISAYYTDELSYNHSNATQDITAGAGQDWVQRAQGLNDLTLDFVLVYDEDDLPDYVDQIEPGNVYAVIYGPNTNNVGSPRLQSNMICASNSHAVNIAKNKVAFKISFQNADTPTEHILNGDTF